MKALIFEGKIVQVSGEEFPVAPGLSWVGCPAGCTPEWVYESGTFSPPVLPNGPSIEELRATAVLGPMELADKLEAIGLFDTVNDWANAAGGKIAYAWNRATQFERTHPLIADAQIGLGLTDEQVDALFGI